MQPFSGRLNRVRLILILCTGLAAVFLLTSSPSLAPAAQAQPPEFSWDAFDPDEESEGGYCAVPAEGQLPSAQYLRRLQDMQPPEDLPFMSGLACEGGLAGIYPCQNVDLLSFMPLAQIGGGSGNDSWGWTDPLTGEEYAIMGRTNGAAFVNISDPLNPLYVGNLATHSSSSTWRDIKVYNNHAFIVSEATNHGMQVFDLTQLRGRTTPTNFAATAHYSQFGRAHNIAINEETGFAYAVGSVQGATTCSGGLHMINIQNPTNPTFAGCFSADGYTHDAQCILYNGPDAAYQGREVCFNSNENTVTIVDVTNKAAPVLIARQGYPGVAYTHQGWLTEDQRYFLVDDELDEVQGENNTRTYVWDMQSLTTPVLMGFYESPVAAIDHNQYVVGHHAYQANYRAGLRILNIAGAAAVNVFQAGYFDIYPASDSPNFNGAWNTYPFFDSGVVLISGIEQGLFMVKPNLHPELSVSMEQPTGIPAAGNMVTYALTVVNYGETAVNNMAAQISVNAVAYPAVGPESIAPGESAVYTLNYQLGKADCLNGLTSWGSARSGEGARAKLDGHIFTAAACGSASLEIDKEQPEGVVVPGETITYTITITNHGDLAATGLIVTDTLNGVATIVPGPTTLDAGATAVYPFTYTVTDADCNIGLTNSAEVSGDNGVVAAMNTPIFTPALCQADLEISKSQPAGTVAPGETITYTITVTNLSAFLATGLVVTDTLNGAALVVPGPTTVDAGATAVYHFSYTITEADCNTGLANLAEVSGDNGAWAVIPDAVYTPVQCQSYLWLPLIMQPGQ
jgi:choice-of-anchor B domain-containing protein